MSEPFPLHRPFDTRRLGVAPMTEKVAASADECGAIATFLGILGVEALSAELTLSRWSGNGVEIRGRLVAQVVQACIVTLEPVEQAIDEAFRLTFLRPDARAADPRTVAEAEVIVHFDQDDPPDILEGPVLDLGALVVEQLALALDPYPRAKGAELSDEFAADAARTNSPFAELMRLKDK